MATKYHYHKVCEFMFSVLTYNIYFRCHLGDASGFQSEQFRMIEIKFGLADVCIKLLKNKVMGTTLYRIYFQTKPNMHLDNFLLMEKWKLKYGINFQLLTRLARILAFLFRSMFGPYLR